MSSVSIVFNRPPTPENLVFDMTKCCHCRYTKKNTYWHLYFAPHWAKVIIFPCRWCRYRVIYLCEMWWRLEHISPCLLKTAGEWKITRLELPRRAVFRNDFDAMWRRSQPCREGLFISQVIKEKNLARSQSCFSLVFFQDFWLRTCSDGPTAPI